MWNFITINTGLLDKILILKFKSKKILLKLEISHISWLLFFCHWNICLYNQLSLNWNIFYKVGKSNTETWGCSVWTRSGFKTIYQLHVRALKQTQESLCCKILPRQPKQIKLPIIIMGTRLNGITEIKNHYLRGLLAIYVKNIILFTYSGIQ